MIHLNSPSLVSFLAGHEASKALRKLVTVDPAFWAEITQPRSRGTPPALTPQQAQSEDLEEVAIDIHGDDSKVPMIDVVAAHTQHPSMDSDHDCNDMLYVPGEEGGLVSTADAERMSTESVNSEMVDASHVEGCGKHAKHPNVLNSSLFWLANDGSDEE
jgi:hypothetical protein